ncbi:MAG: sugar phosphate isomerase/epimerase [Thermotogaceae bacterium]|nr:sugar phosphate isomerase/epimerase [Thermotogaceae bacterium]
MKLALVISTSDAAFNALAFRGDLLNGLVMAKEIGYSAVEIAIRDPKNLDVPQIERSLQQLNMSVVAVGTGQAFLVEKLNMVDPDKTVRNLTRERLKEHIDFASHFGAFVIIGFIRGNRRDRDIKTVRELFISEMQSLCDYAKSRNVKMVIEPLNRYETDFINTLQEAYEIVSEMRCDNVGILADTFHMNIEEANIEKSLKNISSKLFHFHVADSNRWAPGTGHFDFQTTLSVLKKMGYKGYISVECMPLPGGAKQSAMIAYETIAKILSKG